MVGTALVAIAGFWRAIFLFHPVLATAAAGLWGAFVSFAFAVVYYIHQEAIDWNYPVGGWRLAVEALAYSLAVTTLVGHTHGVAIKAGRPFLRLIGAVHALIGAAFFTGLIPLRLSYLVLPRH